MTIAVVDLHPCMSLREIARFNNEIHAEKRLSDAKFLEWKYLKKKPDGSAITEHYGIINDKNELAGQISVQPMEVWLGGRWQQCHYWGDWFIDPNYGGYGLVLLDHVIKRSSSLLAGSATAIALKIYERKKFLLLSVDRRFDYVPRPIRSILSAFKTPRTAAKIFLRWGMTRAPKSANVTLPPEYEFSEEDSVDPDLLLDWESDVPSDTVFVRREGWLFSWLLNKFPYREFRLVALNFEGKPIGYVLLHIRKKPNNLVEGKIVDLFARGWKRDHLAALFNEGVRFLASLRVHIINYHATHPIFVSLAADRGFSLIKTQPIIAYGPLAEALGSGQHSIHMTFYDQDEAYY